MKGARASRTTIALKLGMAVSGFIFLGIVCILAAVAVALIAKYRR